MTKNKTILAFDEALRRYNGDKPLIKISTFVKLFFVVICVIGAFSGEVSEITAWAAVIAFILQLFDKTKPAWGFLLLGLLFNAILGFVPWMAFLMAAGMGFMLWVNGEEV